MCVMLDRPKKQRVVKTMQSGLPLMPEPDLAGLTIIPEADLESIHVIRWEQDIIWDDPDGPDDHAAQLRDDAQNGAAVRAEDDEWDDLDKALYMDMDSPREKQDRIKLPVPILETLPQRPARGTVRPFITT